MKDYSEFVIILDRSGSMQQAASDHEGGLNSFIQDQKRLEGDVRITLIQFDDQAPCEIVHDGVLADKIDKVSLIPRGMTPLLDAVGRGVAHFSKRIESQHSKPDIVVVMIITDGQENASREWTKERVRSLIKDKEKLGWKFLFLGANIDSFSEAVNMGVATAGVMNFVNTSVGVKNVYTHVASGAVCARMATQAGQNASIALSGFDWTEEQRLASMGKGSCTCIGTTNGDPNCPIHRKEVMKGVV